MKKNLFLIFTVLALFSCAREESEFDASGTFEANEFIISAEATGLIRQFDVAEGQSLQEAQYLGYIDSVPLYLKKKQLETQIKSVLRKSPDIKTQTGAYSKQLAVAQSNLNSLLREKTRIENLVRADAATPKQLDDINSQIEVQQKQLAVIQSQEAAQTSMLSTQNRSILSEIGPLQVQVEQLNDQLSKCRIVNPVPGTVLTKFAEVNEMAATGKPLYKIADLSALTLRAYITGGQLSGIKLNQPVRVLVDAADDKSKEYSGTIEWISNKAEFTPKSIQTKDERANLVYAVKIRVKNDGYLKIGMYADVILNDTQQKDL